ncbi:MAG: response regulator [Spirochaetales bacterium]|nr:response regulator [Spirochaetales bacterium]
MKNYIKESKNLKILIAEDDFLVSEMIEGELTSAGYEIVGKASNGYIALELTQSLNPDLILMDIRMPELNGLDASRKIMEICPTPIIILTAYENGDMVVDAGDAGVAAYLNKPLDAQELERAILISIARFKDIMKLREKNSKLEEAEKLNNTLMKEIHHRVKNNFQLISSLLNLQIGSMENEQSKHILEAGRDRVQTLSILHEKLYETGNLVSLPMNIFIEDLLKSLLEAYNTVNKFIKLDLNLDNIVLDSKKAVSIGLILNEAVTNSIKYAFTDKTEQNNTISISMVVEDKNILLSIKDNGIGFSDIDGIKDGNTLGMQLIFLLSESQLDGSIEVNSKEGFDILIRFKP